MQTVFCGQGELHGARRHSPPEHTNGAGQGDELPQERSRHKPLAHRRPLGQGVEVSHSRTQAPTMQVVPDGQCASVPQEQMPPGAVASQDR
jgi:hypothetical protein